MKLKQLNHNNYFLRIDKGEDLIATIKTVYEQQKWNFCQFQAIGGLKNITIGFLMKTKAIIFEKQLMKCMKY